MFKSIGNDGCSETSFLNVKNGEADAVEANGTFFNHKMAELFWKFKPKHVTAF
jgi:hypothetical protein